MIGRQIFLSRCARVSRECVDHTRREDHTTRRPPNVRLPRPLRGNGSMYRLRPLDDNVREVLYHRYIRSDLTSHECQTPSTRQPGVCVCVCVRITGFRFNSIHRPPSFAFSSPGLKSAEIAKYILLPVALSALLL
jgi:hypothetical protein